jgi:hypothetical protein
VQLLPAGQEVVQRSEQYPPCHREPLCVKQVSPSQVMKLVQVAPTSPEVGATWQVPDVQLPEVQVLPEQQGWPTPPQAGGAWQVPDWHVPWVQVVPQQGWPRPPQARHVPDWQTADPRQAVPLVQQAWLTLPQLAAL